MNKNILGGIVIAVLLVFSGISAFKPINVQVQVPQGFGSVTSPDIASPYFSFGGIRVWGAKTDTLTAATTTVCALQSPVSTSTLMSAAIHFSISSTTATTLTIATSTSAFSTSTPILIGALSANESDGFAWTATASTSNSTILRPSSWVVFGLSGGAGTFSPTGNCSATFQQIAY